MRCKNTFYLREQQTGQKNNVLNPVKRRTSVELDDEYRDTQPFLYFCHL